MKSIQAKLISKHCPANNILSQATLCGHSVCANEDIITTVYQMLGVAPTNYTLTIFLIIILLNCSTSYGQSNYWTFIGFLDGHIISNMDLGSNTGFYTRLSFWQLSQSAVTELPQYQF